jgi:hypothetical protein
LEAVDKSHWVRVVEYNKVVFDDAGFQYPGENATRVYWHSVLRVAIGYEIHPIVIVDWDFIAFQSEEENVTYWVHAVPGDAFTSEVRRRYGAPDIPPMKDGEDEGFCIRACTIWPPAEIGRPMFKSVKRHWWSWRAYLAYTEFGNQAVCNPCNGRMR